MIDFRAIVFSLLAPGSSLLAEGQVLYAGSYHKEVVTYSDYPARLRAFTEAHRASRARTQ